MLKDVVVFCLLTFSLTHPRYKYTDIFINVDILPAKGIKEIVLVLAMCNNKWKHDFNQADQ